MTTPARNPLATAFVLVRPTTTGFGPALKRDLEGQAGAAGAAGKKTGASWAKGFQASGITRVSKVITEGIAAAGVASVVLAAKFQTTMEKLSTQAGVGQGQVKKLGEGILTLAGQVGFSPDSLAQSLYHVESNFQSLGITGPKALQLVKIAAEGAKTGGADLGDVTNALTAAVASGIPGVTSFGKAMGILNKIVGVGDMSMQDLADAFGTGLLASVKGFGVSITDVGAALAVFGDNNIRGAKAGQQLRMAIQALAAPTGAGKKILEGWGWSVDRLANDMRKGGLKLALEDLQAKFRKTGITSKEQGQVITELFGKRAGVGIQILLGQMGRLESKYPELSKGASGFSTAWTKTQKLASTQLSELGHGFEAMGVKIGEKLLPPLQAVMGFVRTHTGLVLTLAAGIGGVAVAITAVNLGINAYRAALAIWTGVTKIAAAAQWIWNAALSANPIGLIIIGIAALVTGVILAYQHFKGFRDFVSGAWNFLKAATKVFVDGMLTFLGMIVHGAADAFGWIPGIGPKLKDAAAAFDRFHQRVDDALSFHHKTVTVGVTILPTGKHITAAAAGWRVPGWGGGDRWPAMLEGGEAVVPKHLVGAIAPFLSANRVPGFAAGGIMGGLSVQPAFPSVPAMAAAALAIIRHLAQANVGALFARAGGAAPAALESFAASLFGAYGWGLSQLPPLVSLWNRESGWRWNATNPSSGAYGIPQSLPASKMAAAGADWRTNPFTQIRWGESYIAGRYGSPAGAWAHELSAGWYGGGLRNGLFTRPTLIGVGERGPELVNITPGGRGGRGGRIVLEVRTRGGTADDFLAAMIRQYVRVVGGGSVQDALGQ